MASVNDCIDFWNFSCISNDLANSGLTLAAAAACSAVNPAFNFCITIVLANSSLDKPNYFAIAFCANLFSDAKAFKTS